MSTKTQFASVKLSADFVDEARVAAKTFSRSLAGQLEYWARLGKALEQGPGFTMTRAQQALDGTIDPAALSSEERRYYYQLLDERMASPSASEVSAMRSIGLAPGAVGYDEQDRLVRVELDGTTTVIEE